MVVHTKTCTRCGGTGQIPDTRRLLSTGEVAAIRARSAAGEPLKVLASDYHTTESNVSRIVRHLARVDD